MSTLEAVMARVADLVVLARTAFVEEMSTRPVRLARPTPPSGTALAALVGPLIPSPTRSRVLVRPVSPPRARAGGQPSRGGSSVRPATRTPSIGTFTAGPEEPVLSTDLVSSERGGVLPPADGREPAGPRISGAPPDALWVQTAALSLAILLLFGAATYAKNRRRTMREYAGYYR